MHADITIFDPDKVIDKGTYQDPIQFPEGIEYVIVNGFITVENGVHTGRRAGKVLRHS
jgi:N-acyl-D-amino-acid deacylase